MKGWQSRPQVNDPAQPLRARWHQGLWARRETVHLVTFYPVPSTHSDSHYRAEFMLDVISVGATSLAMIDWHGVWKKFPKATAIACEIQRDNASLFPLSLRLFRTLLSWLELPPALTQGTYRYLTGSGRCRSISSATRFLPPLKSQQVIRSCLPRCFTLR